MRADQTLRRACIAGTGSFLPDTVTTNEDLERMVDTSDEWIRTRTGIRERRIAGPEITVSQMAVHAGRQALARAGVAAEEVDLILVATCTPDMLFPNTACLVQNQLGAHRAFGMDLSAACSGFCYGLETARQYVETGAAETVLVIGSEKMSTITDWEDRTTCVLFGDGAGAAVVRPAGPGQRGILASRMGSDGGLGDLLRIPAGGSLLPASRETVDQRLHTIKMQGREVFKHAVTNMTRAIRDVLEDAGVGLEDIRCVIPHQANMRIIEAIRKHLDVAPERVFTNVERYGNTSAASVAVALDEALQEGRIAPGDLVVLVVFGAGFTWAATILEWNP